MSSPLTHGSKSDKTSLHWYQLEMGTKIGNINFEQDDQGISSHLCWCGIDISNWLGAPLCLRGWLRFRLVKKDDRRSALFPRENGSVDGFTLQNALPYRVEWCVHLRTGIDYVAEGWPWFPQLSQVDVRYWQFFTMIILPLKPFRKPAD